MTRKDKALEVLKAGGHFMVSVGVNRVGQKCQVFGLYDSGGSRLKGFGEGVIIDLALEGVLEHNTNGKWIDAKPYFSKMKLLDFGAYRLASY